MSENVRVLSGPWEFDQMHAEALERLRAADTFFLTVLTDDEPVTITAHSSGDGVAYLDLLSTARCAAIWSAVQLTRLACEDSPTTPEEGNAS